jgi:hypothetical protein
MKKQMHLVSVMIKSNFYFIWQQVTLIRAYNVPISRRQDSSSLQAFQSLCQLLYSWTIAKSTWSIWCLPNLEDVASVQDVLENICIFHREYYDIGNRTPYFQRTGENLPTNCRYSLLDSEAEAVGDQVWVISQLWGGGSLAIYLYLAFGHWKSLLSLSLRLLSRLALSAHFQHDRTGVSEETGNS